MTSHKPKLCQKCNSPISGKGECTFCEAHPLAAYNPYDLWHRNDEAARICRGPARKVAGGYIRA